VTYDVILLNYRRPENIPALVAIMRRQDPAPRHVLVWHNAPEGASGDFGTRDVYSRHNWGCQARHALGLLSGSESLVFVDDDVLPTCAQFAAPLLAALQQYPEAVVGPECRRLQGCGPEMYWGKDAARYSHAQGPVSVVKGKIHACRRELLALPFARALPEEIRAEDDIVLCAATQEVADVPSRCVAGMRAFYRNLSDDRGNERRPDHFERRNRACRYMASMGWDVTLWKR